MKIMVLFLIVTMLVSCDSSETAAVELVTPEYYQIKIHDTEVSSQFQLILENENIFYEELDPETIKVKFSDQNKIDILYFEYIKDDLPKGRSVSLSMPGLEEKVISDFITHDINFIKKRRYGKSWLVWSSDDTDEANKIIREWEERLMNEYMENINNNQ